VLDGRPAASAPASIAAKGRNAGQWALTGGRVDLGETSVETALRELAKETGVEAPASAVAGLLDDYVARTCFVSTPVVVLLDAPPTRLRRCPREVHSLHRGPLVRLCDEDVPRWRETPDGSRPLQMPLGRSTVVHARPARRCGSSARGRCSAGPPGWAIWTSRRSPAPDRPPEASPCLRAPLPPSGQSGPACATFRAPLSLQP
jgi:8-oxo-dGTP pyrophosphatase MutT (NUDIX family)